MPTCLCGTQRHTEQSSRTVQITSLESNSRSTRLDSTRLVSATLNKAIIARRKRVQTLDHVDRVTAAKYSPQGDRVATATRESVRVWDSNDGRLLIYIPLVKVTPEPFFIDKTGLLWSNNHLYVISDNKIKQLEASTGSTSSEWGLAAPRTLYMNDTSSIALPQHQEFIVYSTKDTVTFWDTTTHTQLGLFQRTQDIRSIAVSPDDRFLAIGEQGEKITINGLSGISVSILLVGLWCI